MKSNLTWAFVGGTALSLTACASASGLEGEDVATVEQQVDALNGLSTNGLSTNGLSTNGLSTNGLSTNGLSTNSLVMNKLGDPYAQQLLGYIVGCALTPAQSVDLTVNGQALHYQGELGLAPAWGDPSGTCDAQCQSWVSACIISRLNYLGQHVDVSLRGSALGLATTPAERSGFPRPEGTYYGDIFNGLNLYRCTINGLSPLNERVCGPPTDNCIVHLTGECRDVCDAPSPDPDGYYMNCRDASAAPGTTYPGSITVYRQ